MVKLLSENIKDEIFDLFESSEKEINIISPFIGIQTAKEIVKIIKEKNINVTLITRFNRSDFYSKASSLEALNLLSDNNVKILAVKKLHTKLYIGLYRTRLDRVSATNLCYDKLYFLYRIRFLKSFFSFRRFCTTI